MSSSDTLINTLFDGRYRILRKLGSGGMANVYLAEDEELGRRIAIKILSERCANDEQFIERFRREAKAAAGLSHPNIVSIYDRGEAEGTYYIAMEVIEGGSLKELILAGGALEVEEAIAYGQQILSALRFAHQRGVVHRDIKPHNILLGPERQLKVTDFGIARAGASQMTEVGSIMGTAHYLSPEQARGAVVTAASDLYSVGVVLYEMLTGQVPFQGDTPVEIAMKHLSEPPRAPSQVGGALGRVPYELDQVILRALAKNPEHRYQSAAELSADLERVVAGVPLPEATVDMAATVFLARDPQVDATQVIGGAQSRSLPDNDGRDRRRRALPWLFLTLLLVAAALASWYVFTRIQDELEAARPVAVPYVIGIERELAENRIEEAGLVPELREEFSREAPPGIVFDQDPSEGTRISKGERVTVLVSKGLPKVEVPFLVGLSYEEAINDLDALELKWTRRDIFSRRPLGVVVSQHPEPGTRLEVGRTVLLRVSKGQRVVVVPNVIGQDEASARVELELSGFEVETMPTEAGESQGTVVNQSPDAGAEAPRGSLVRIFVSSGPQLQTVPPVVGADEETAKQALRDAGFKVDVVDVETFDPDQEGEVLGQDPSGGGQAEAGSTVTIQVGRFGAGIDTAATPSG